MNPADPIQVAPGADAGVTRRHLLDSLLAGGACIWAAGIAIPTSLYLWPAGTGGPDEAYVKAGTIADFPVGSARLLQHRGKPLIVLRLSTDEFRAFSAICTHLGCIVRWDDATRRIHCPCHAGFFGPDGAVLSGPPPRPLPAYKVVAAGDELRVYT
jgi:cytochrome b6-f complex iron-sulfur subunit